MPERHADATPEPPEEAGRERYEDVLARVRELLGKYPNVGSRQLFDLATRMHPDLEQAGFRSFHARYVLPLKREIARAEGRLPKARTPKTVTKRPRRTRTAHVEEPARVAAPVAPDPTQARVRVRDVLLRLARQVAIAESRADLVDALARVEDMVEEVLQVVQPQQSATARPERESDTT